MSGRGVCSPGPGERTQTLNTGPSLVFGKQSEQQVLNALLKSNIHMCEMIIFVSQLSVSDSLDTYLFRSQIRNASPFDEGGLAHPQV